MFYRVDILVEDVKVVLGKLWVLEYEWRRGFSFFGFIGFFIIISSRLEIILFLFKFLVRNKNDRFLFLSMYSVYILRGEWEV